MRKLRTRIFEIIEVAEDGDLVSNIYDAVMLITIIVSLIPLCTKSTALWTVIIDYITVSIFIVDYVLRLFTADLRLKRSFKSFILYPVTPLAILDLLSILPSFLTLARGLKIMKVFRLLKTAKALKALKGLKAFKSFKVLRYSSSFEIIINVIKKQRHALLTVLGLSLGYIFLSALIAFNVEPETFPTFFAAIYWACISLTTVGYGDSYCVTVAGQIITMLSSLVGVAIVALPAGIITAGYMEELQKKGNASTTDEDS